MNRLTVSHRHYYVEVGPSKAWPETHIRLECSCGRVKVRPIDPDVVIAGPWGAAASRTKGEA